jgi:hypothetical protein
VVSDRQFVCQGHARSRRGPPTPSSVGGHRGPPIPADPTPPPPGVFVGFQIRASRVPPRRQRRKSCAPSRWSRLPVSSIEGRHAPRGCGSLCLVGHPEASKAYAWRFRFGKHGYGHFPSYETRTRTAGSGRNAAYLPREVFFGRLGLAGAFLALWGGDFGRFFPAMSGSFRSSGDRARVTLPPDRLAHS